MLKEFRAFAFKGNVIDLAVGVVIGVAFNAIITSMVDDVIMQAIAAIFGKPDFSALQLDIGRGVLRYGNFLTALVNFILIAFSLFLFVKTANRTVKKAERDEKPSVRECPYCLTSIPAKASRCSSCTSEIEPAAA